MRMTVAAGVKTSREKPEIDVVVVEKLLSQSLVGAVDASGPAPWTG